MAKAKLSELQRRFCEEYIARKGHATAAYEAAGYNAKNTNSIASSASTLLRNPKIQAYIYKLREEVAQAAIAPLTEIVENLSYIARSDISDTAKYSDKEMKMENINDLPKEIRGAIASIGFTETHTEQGTVIKKSIKMHSKTAAAALLFQYYGMGTDLNQAIATFKRYGWAVIPDPAAPKGLRFELLAD